MTSLRLLMLVLLVARVESVGLSATSEREEKSPNTISAEDLSSGRIAVVGMLGIPLGTIVEIEAVVVPDPFFDHNPLVEPGDFYALRVESVDGQPLPEPVVMRFNSSIHSTVRLASSKAKLEGLLKAFATPGARTEIVSGGTALTTAEPLSAAEIEEFRRNYMGSRHRLAVYEGATFSGAPEKVPQDCGAMVGGLQRFQFRTQLQVLVERVLERSQGPTQ